MMSILGKKLHLIKTLTDADVLENSKPITSAVLSKGPIQKEDSDSKESSNDNVGSRRPSE